MPDNQRTVDDVIAELRSMAGCVPGCNGRCVVCPDQIAQEAADELLRLRSLAEQQEVEIADLKVSVIAFGAPSMVEWAKDHGLPDHHLYASHYDILAKAGARMVAFTRWEEPT